MPESRDVKYPPLSTTVCPEMESLTLSNFVFSNVPMTFPTSSTLLSVISSIYILDEFKLETRI